MLEPSTPITKAYVDPDDHKNVHLTAELDPKSTYTVIVTDVLSADMQPLIVGKNLAEFKTA